MGTEYSARDSAAACVPAAQRMQPLRPPIHRILTCTQIPSQLDSTQTREVQQCPDCSHACLTRARILVGQIQCESVLQLTQFDQTHTVMSTIAITSIIDQLNLHQLTRTRGRSAACFGGFRSAVHARASRDAHGDGRTWRRTVMERSRIAPKLPHYFPRASARR